jgi:hypothetical protein
LTGIAHSPVKITRVVISGLIDLAPGVKALKLRRTCGIGLAATMSSLFDLVEWPATMPERNWDSSM